MIKTLFLTQNKITCMMHDLSSKKCLHQRTVAFCYKKEVFYTKHTCMGVKKWHGLATYFSRFKRRRILILSVALLQVMHNHAKCLICNTFFPLLRSLS